MAPSSTRPPQSNSPMPQWEALIKLFGSRELSRLAGISQTSLRRYMSSPRATPSSVALRLEWLAAVVEDLRGGYNDGGIKQWFDRPRPQLQGLSPWQSLPDGWSPEDENVRRVRMLARLRGSQDTSPRGNSACPSIGAPNSAKAE